MLELILFGNDESLVVGEFSAFRNVKEGWFLVAYHDVVFLLFVS